MHERLKKLRKTLDLTQQEFADKIRVKRNTVATYEMGRSEPSDAAISLICTTFNVSEVWLREGTGEMFVPQTGDIKSLFFKNLTLLDEYDWELLFNMVEILAKRKK